MPEPVVEIPNRPVFRASEVCELAQIPPYVLKSWEKEFPGLGLVPRPGGPRVYRRSDVEQVLRIKELLFKHGMTLAGARRKLEGEPKVEEEPLPDLPVAGEVREKVGRIKQELRSLLDMLSAPALVHREPLPPGAAAPAGPADREEGHPVQAAAAQAVATEAAASPAGEQEQRGQEQRGQEQRVQANPVAEELPLLEGVPAPAVDAPKRPRRPRRAHGGPPPG